MLQSGQLAPSLLTAPIVLCLLQLTDHALCSYLCHSPLSKKMFMKNIS